MVRIKTWHVSLADMHGAYKDMARIPCKKRLDEEIACTYGREHCGASFDAAVMLWKFWQMACI
jgi:hypothetical protein